MDLRRLARIDFNLLLTLKVLLEEGSVSKTADKLFLTQPAISKSLSRLRDMFADPLFTRSGRGLVPTPFALSLLEPLNLILGEMENLFVAESFDPASYKGEFIFAVNEFMDMILLPLLVEELSRVAPGIHLETLTQVDDQLAGLEKGELDFVLNMSFSEIPESYHSDLILKDKPSLFARENHPLMKGKKLGFQDVSNYPRVALNMPDMDKLSVFSSGRAPSRQSSWKSAFDTENLITALAVICRTDYLLPGPGLMRHFSTKELVFKALPFEMNADIKIEYCLVSHDRVANSPAHQWLRERIIALAEQLGV
jgi:DNA-binding transcriptional LysR family regulator